MIKEIGVADVTGALTKIGTLSADLSRVTDGIGVRLLRKEETVTTVKFGVKKTS